MTFIWLMMALHPNPDFHMPIVAFRDEAKCEVLAEALRKKKFLADCTKVEIR